MVPTTLRTDVLIIGSEGAGARAAIAAHDSGADVLLVTKGRFGKSGATITGIADIDVDSRSARDLLGLEGDPGDSKDIFFEDILIEGKYLNNQKLIELHVEEAPFRLKEMMDWGMKPKGLLLSPGHRYPRGVLTAGIEIMRVLKKQVSMRKIKVIEDMLVVDILTSRDGAAVGAMALDLRKGEFVVLSSRTTVIATGGGMMIYPIQTAPQDLTGDGQAMAYRAGADLIDMEMTQFHPCNFLSPPIWRGIGFPFTIGPAGGMDVWLLNKFGQRFMSKWDPKRMEKTTRDTLSIGIMTEILEGRGSPSGGVYMSLAHLPSNLVDDFLEWFSKGGLIGPNWTYQGFHFSELMEKVKKGYAMEVTPASHFFMGGIKINERCETNIPGLYAAGEAAGGTHGANRLSGNALTQVLVQGTRAGKVSAEVAKRTDGKKPEAEQVERIQERFLRYLQNREGFRPAKLRKELQEWAWKRAGIVRDGSGLKEILEWVKELKREKIPQMATGAKERQYNREWIEAIQFESLSTILEAVATSALLREESRGAHYRKDFTETENRWLKNICLKKEGDTMSSSVHPIVVTRWKPERESHE